MQLSDIVLAVRKILGETESAYGTLNNGQGTWDDTQIAQYVNDGLGLVSHVVRLEGTATIPLITSMNTYNLPSDCLEDGIRSIVYNAKGAYGPVRVDPIQLEDYEREIMNQPYSSGVPNRYRYTVWAGQILLTPYPAQQGDNLTIRYYQTMQPLVNPEDEPVFPSRFHVALVHYAAARCHQAVADSNLYQEQINEYEMVVSQIRMELSRTSRDRNRVRRK